MLVVFPIPGMPYTRRQRALDGNFGSTCRYYNVWTVPISRNHFQPLNSVRIAHDVVQDLRSVLFDPTLQMGLSCQLSKLRAYHGSSYGVADAAPSAGALPLITEEVMTEEGERGCGGTVTQQVALPARQRS